MSARTVERLTIKNVDKCRIVMLSVSSLIDRVQRIDRGRGLRGVCRQYFINSIYYQIRCSKQIVIIHFQIQRWQYSNNYIQPKEKYRRTELRWLMWADVVNVVNDMVHSFQGHFIPLSTELDNNLSTHWTLWQILLTSHLRFLLATAPVWFEIFYFCLK